MAAALGQLTGFVFQIPAALGYGQHWPLDPREEKNWGRSLEGCLKSLPKKSRANWSNAVSKWMPWMALTMTAYVTVMPRYMLTSMQRRGSAAVSREPEQTPKIDGEVTGVRTWEDYQRSRGGA